MTRIVRFHETGGPEVLKFENAEIRAPGAGEVVVRMEAIGLNRAEVGFRRDQYLESPKLPAGLGYEGAGIVEQVGPDVDHLAVGDAVCVVPAFSMNDYTACGERALLPARAVLQRPPGLTAVQAAAVPMQYLTAWGALIDIAKMTLGDFVIIPAASSSVGIAAIQLANAAGAIPIATTRTSAKRQALLDLGAAHVVATGEQDLAAEVMRITGGVGARIAFDPVGGPAFAAIAEAMARYGIMFWYGGLSGQPITLPRAVMRSALSVRGWTLFELTPHPDKLKHAFAAISHGLASKRLVPVIARTFPFEQVVDAYRFMESNEQIGKIVLTVP